MENKKKYLAIIPARGGSKRLPRKNVLLLAGKPLIAWTIEAAKNCQEINHLVVSSEDCEILSIAENFGASIVKRPSELAQDTSSSFDAIKHAIEANPGYEYIVLLQPTSPFRTEKHIYDAIQLLERNKADAVVSVCEVEHSPLWANTLAVDGSMSNFLRKDILNLRSQDLPTYFRLNGAIYICKIEKLLKERSFLISDNIYAYKMDMEASVDIDTKMDFKWAEFLFNNSIS